jgi:hypothetical protein
LGELAPNRTFVPTPSANPHESEPAKPACTAPFGLITLTRQSQLPATKTDPFMIARPLAYIKVLAPAEYNSDPSKAYALTGPGFCEKEAAKRPFATATACILEADVKNVAVARLFIFSVRIAMPSAMYIVLSAKEKDLMPLKVACVPIPLENPVVPLPASVDTFQ